MEKKRKADKKSKYSSPSPSGTKEHPKKSYNEPDRGAPYNFIPLNKHTILSDWGEWKQIPPFNKYHKECGEKKVYTGRIEINATAKTPIYIRDLSLALRKDEQPEGFFGETINNLRIPGSSIRGMIRNLVEIVSHGKFLSTDYQRLGSEKSRKTIGDCIPFSLLKPNHSKSPDPNPEHPDICQALFGSEERAAGRVFFEDLTLLPDQKEVKMDKQSPKILSSPNPAVYQNYLEQPSGSEKTNTNLHNWNTSHARIRGYKLYWHRNTAEKGENSWSEGTIIKGSQRTTIQPIRSGTRFQGAIRFENLSEIELGALLYVLQLPENCAHKIGMGKPLGLGSVRIEAKLVIQDRVSAEGRYAKLFGKTGMWEEGNAERDSGVSSSFSYAFEQYIINQIIGKSNETYNELSKVPRIKSLFHMLDYNNTKSPVWLEITCYQIGNKKRGLAKKALPTPEEVVG